jgi:hypothetical protein
MNILLILLSLSLIDEIAPFRYVLNIASDGHKVYSSSPFGIAEFDFYTGDYVRGYIMQDEVEIVAPDIYSGYIYYSSRSNLYRFSPASNFRYPMGVFFNIKSIGITQNEIYIDEGGAVKIIDKFTGIPKTSGKGGVLWFGEKKNLRKDSKDIFFLSPYYYYVPNFGKIEYTVFYEEKNKIFAGTWGDGIHIYQKGLFMEEKKQRIGPATPYITVIKNTKNGIWIGGKDYRGYSGLTRRKANDWIVYKKEEVFGLPDENIVDIEGIGDRTYFAYPGGISVFEKERFYRLTGTYLSLRECTAIFADYPNIWVGTDDGIYTVDSETGDILSQFLRGIYVEDIEKLGGIIFAGTEKGLLYISPDKKDFKVFNDEKQYSLSHILKLGNKNDTLIVACAKGVFMIFKENNKFKTHYLIPPFSPNILDIKPYKDMMFFATLDGLYFYNIKKDFWKREYFAKKDFGIAVFSLMIKGDTLWVGTDKGIFLLKL